jgi:hypothetical protein
MSTRIVFLALLTALVAGCKSVDCGAGTTERDGACVASSQTVAAAKCGPFTELHGDTCVPMFPPTTCDPGSTDPDLDISTGVVTCIGNGGGGCSAKLACPTPAAGDPTQTICGQIYDFETGQPFADASATGAKCAAVTVSGPCSLGIRAFDAAALAMNPTTTPPLATGAVYIDDCGRYKVPGVAQPTGPFVALAIDDAAMASAGPAGTTNPTGVALARGSGQASKDVEAFVIKGSTAIGWGSPSLAAGIYAPVYRAHRTGFDNQAGVTFAFGPMGSAPTMTDMNRDFYFGAASTTRTTLDGAANVTGSNGTALVKGATLAEVYSGQGAIPSTCIWEPHAGGAVPNVVFIQIFRPIDAPSMTCPL